MAFESGGVSLRMFYLPGKLPDDHIERFAAQAAPPLNLIGNEVVSGWVTGRHLLDRQINEDSALVSGYLRLTLMKAEKKIPEALLRAECRMEELAEIQARDFSSLPRARRSEIRKEVSERLIQGIPPTLTGIPIVYDYDDELLYVGATSDKQTDAIVLAFRQATGLAPIMVTPETASLKRKHLNARDLTPTSFSPEVEDALAGDSLGHDFLTWLWFYSEQRGGMLSCDFGRFGVGLDGPIMLVLEGDGAHVTMLQKGTPLVSAEAKTALQSGKKLARASVMMARGDEAWQFVLDAAELTLRSVKLPKGDSVDAIGRFQDRMMALRTMRIVLMTAFDMFLEERFNPEKWAETNAAMRAWVSDRISRI
jgi:hypothetical protein